MADEYNIRLKSGDEIVHEIAASNQSDAMVSVAEFLLKERHLLDNISLPYSPGRRESPLFDRVHNGIDEQEHKIGSEYYIDTLFNQEAKKRNLKRLAAECDLNAEFGGDW